MPDENTPPVSPLLGMDNDDIYEDEIEEVDNEIGLNAEDIVEDIDDAGGNEDLDDEEGDMSAEEPSRDDADIVFSNHTGSVFCCDIDPKLGQFAVTGGEDDRAFVWDINSANVFLECKGHSDSVISTEFNHDGTYVATGDMKGMIQVWKMSTKTAVWDTNSDELLWMKWHPAANVLFAGTNLGDVYVYKIPSGEFKILAGHGSKCSCGVIMPDGKRIAVGYDDGMIKVFDIKMTNPIHRIQTGNPDADASVMCIDVNIDNNLLITGDLCGDVKLITSQNGKVVGSLPTSALGGVPSAETSEEECRSMHSVESVSFCKDTSTPVAAIGNLNGILCVWDVSRQIVRHAIKQNSGISKILWDRNSSHVYVGCLDSSVKLYDTRTGSIVREYLGHRRDILDINLSRDGSKLLATSDDKTARVFSTTIIDR